MLWLATAEAVASSTSQAPECSYTLLCRLALKVVGWEAAGLAVVDCSTKLSACSSPMACSCLSCMTSQMPVQRLQMQPLSGGKHAHRHSIVLRMEAHKACLADGLEGGGRGDAGPSGGLGSNGELHRKTLSAHRSDAVFSGYRQADMDAVAACQHCAAICSCQETDN